MQRIISLCILTVLVSTSKILDNGTDKNISNSSLGKLNGLLKMSSNSHDQNDLSSLRKDSVFNEPKVQVIVNLSNKNQWDVTPGQIKEGLDIFEQHLDLKYVTYHVKPENQM